MEHLRAFLFVPFSWLKSPGPFEKAFYFLTGLGHQSVMIFFVLSGFLVGGSVISSVRKGSWSWKGYLLRRMTRLWVVLIPALLLTLFWDKLGSHYAVTGYQGGFRELYNSGPSPASPADLSPIAFVENLSFLQTILGPCFGTNGPLWSLANEFWYYLLFPLLLTPFISKSAGVRIFSVVAILAILLFLPKRMLAGCMIWGLGAGVYYLTLHEGVRKVGTSVPCLAFGFFLTLVSLFISRFGLFGRLDGLADCFIGLSVAILVLALVFRGGGSGLYSKCSKWGSEISYTLYLIHFPLLAFLFFVFFRGQQMVLSIYGEIIFVSLLTGVIFCSTGIWWIFERNTDRIRKSIEQMVS